ncbi:MAG: DUF5723 family protein [Rhodothermales bacterium]
MKRIFSSIFLVAVLAVSFTTKPAQAQLDLRGAATLSTGGGGAAYVRDTDALFLNPGNLLLDDRGSRVVVTLGALQAYGGGSLLQFNHYTNNFTGGNLIAPADVDVMLDDWFGSNRKAHMRQVGVATDVVPLAFMFRTRHNWAAGMAVRSRTFNQVGVSRGLFELLLEGTDQTAQLPVNVDAQSMAITEISVAYSRLLPRYRFHFGIAPKLVLGHHYARGWLGSKLNLDDDAISHQLSYVTRIAGPLASDAADAFTLFEDSGFLSDAAAPDFGDPTSFIAGKGFGFDLGITNEFNNDLYFAFSFTDLGFVRWTQNADAVVSGTHEFQFGGLDVDLDRLNDEFDGDLGAYAEDVLTELVEGAYDTYERWPGAFTTSLPTAMHAGVSWHRMGGRLILNGGSSMALNTEAGNMSRVPSLHAGVSFSPGRRYSLPLRTGVRVGGGGAMTLGFGFGILTPVYDINIGLAATPRSDLVGGGARYMLAVSVANIRI